MSVRSRGCPRVEHGLQLALHLLAGSVTRDAGHQELVVGGIDVSDRGNHGGVDCFGLHGATGPRPADAATGSGAGVGSDRLASLRWTAGEHAADLVGERLQQSLVLCRPPAFVPSTATASG